MKTYLLSLVLLSASAASLTAMPITYYANLDGPSESPPNASLGTGFTFITIDPVAHTLEVSASFGGLTGVTTVAHIHVINGPGDANVVDTLGPVATTTPTFPGFPAGVASGMYNQTFDTLSAATYRAGFVTDSGSVGAAETELFTAIGSGRAYLNIHSTVYPGGEIRGFLTEIPEPASFGLVALTLSGLALYRRKRAMSTL